MPFRTAGTTDASSTITRTAAKIKHTQSIRSFNRSKQKNDTQLDFYVPCKRGNTKGFRNIDMYGQEINLTYKGDYNYKTTPGAVATLCVCIVMLSYAIYRSLILLNRYNPEINTKSLKRDLDLEGNLSPGLDTFDFAFGLG